MPKRSWVVILAMLFTACATAPPEETAAARAPGISPADLVASISDVAAGRNADMREAGIYLKSIEFKLLVGTERETGGKAHIVLLDAEASRKSEVSFLQTFVLEAPSAPVKSLASPVLPEVRQFVEAAMETARSIARVAAREGLPQRIESVELVAKLAASRKAGGGIAFTVPVLTGVGLEGGASRTAQEANTVKLVFLRVP
jgi:NTP-dependent ternary system trypsin peptidase co-occuring protein